MSSTELRILVTQRAGAATVSPAWLSVWWQSTAALPSALAASAMPQTWAQFPSATRDEPKTLVLPVFLVGSETQTGRCWGFMAFISDSWVCCFLYRIWSTSTMLVSATSLPAAGLCADGCHCEVANPFSSIALLLLFLNVGSFVVWGF